MQDAGRLVSSFPLRDGIKTDIHLVGHNLDESFKNKIGEESYIPGLLEFPSEVGDRSD
jgi:hypothetical protein